MSIRNNSDYRYIYTHLDTNPPVFRYWGDLPREVLEVLRYRTPIGYYLTEGFVKEAIQPGFDIIDSNDKIVHDEEDNYDVIVADVIEKYCKAKAAEKAFGYCVLTYLKFEGNSQPVLYWIEDTHITQTDIEEGTKNITGLKFTPPNYLGYSSVVPIELKNKQLNDVRLLGNYDSTIGYFRSYLEPIADDLIALSNLSQQSAVLMIRIGSGIRYIQAPSSMLQNSTTRTELTNFLENMGINSILVVPDGMAESGEFLFDIKFGEGSPPDFTLHRDIHLENISAYTGIPREVFIGSELGLRSAETNRQSFLNQLAREQNDSVNHLLWMLSKVLDCEACASGEHSIRFKPLIEMDESEKIELMQKKIDILSKVDVAILKALDPEQLLQVLELEVDFDSAKYEEQKLQNEMMKEALSNQEGTDQSDETRSNSLQDRPDKEAEEETDSMDSNDST